MVRYEALVLSGDVEGAFAPVLGALGLDASAFPSSAPNRAEYRPSRKPKWFARTFVSRV